MQFAQLKRRDFIALIGGALRLTNGKTTIESDGAGVTWVATVVSGVTVEYWGASADLSGQKCYISHNWSRPVL